MRPPELTRYRRPKGTGRLRADGRWEVRVAVGYDRGRQLMRSFYGRTKVEASTRAAAWKFIPISEKGAWALIARHSACWICGAAGPVEMDHDHATGEMRGVLCHRCNVGLSWFSDDPERLRSAARYLGIARDQETPDEAA